MTLTLSGDVVVKKILVTSINRNHFARTMIESQLYNPAASPQEASFTFVIPDGAIVSGLTMITENSFHTAKLETTSDAEAIFRQAKLDNSSALIFRVRSNSPNELELVANVRGFSPINFALAYDEYLPLRNNSHTQRVRFKSNFIGQRIDGIFTVNLDTDGDQKLHSIRILDRLPALEDFNLAKDANSSATMGRDGYSGRLRMVAHLNKIMSQDPEQEAPILDLGVVYTMKNSSKESTVVSKNYFVHYFPNEVLQLPKHVVLIMDISGSMAGKKLEQTKDTLIQILDSLSDKDYFNLITFSTSVQYFHSRPLLASWSRNAAIDFTRSLVAGGVTNIHDALLEGLRVAERAKRDGTVRSNTDQFIFFMTDGNPCCDRQVVTDTGAILQRVRSSNTNRVPIHSLAFGNDVNFDFVKKISAENFGIATRWEIL